MADARTDTPARMYGKVVGVVLLLVAIVGFIAGDPEDGLLGLLNIDIVEDIIHLGSAAVLLYAGFAATAEVARKIVAGLSVIYLIVGVAGFVEPELFGLIPHEYNVADNIVHLALGALGLFAVSASKGAGTATV